MKDSTAFAMFLGFLLFMLIGGIAGYAIATDQVHKQAIANGAGHNTIVDGKVEFAWGEPRN